MNGPKPSKSKQDNWIESMPSPPYPYKNLGLEQEVGMVFERGVYHSPRSWNLSKLVLHQNLLYQFGFH